MGHMQGPSRDPDTHEAGHGSRTAISVLEENKMRGERSLVWNSAKHVPGKLLIPLENSHIKVYEDITAAPLQESQRTGRKSGSQAWHRVDVCGFIRRAVSQLLPCLAPENSKGR